MPRLDHPTFLLGLFLASSGLIVGLGQLPVFTRTVPEVSELQQLDSGQVLGKGVAIDPVSVASPTPQIASPSAVPAISAESNHLKK